MDRHTDRRTDILKVGQIDIQTDRLTDEGIEELVNMPEDVSIVSFYLD